MSHLIDRRALFDHLLDVARRLLTEEDLKTLRDCPKDVALYKLHFGAGLHLRSALGLWGEDASDRFRAIEDHAGQGPLLGFSADDASSAMLGHLWDRTHAEERRTHATR